MQRDCECTFWSTWYLQALSLIILGYYYLVSSQLPKASSKDKKINKQMFQNANSKFHELENL